MSEITVIVENAFNVFSIVTDLTDSSKKQPIFLDNFRGESDHCHTALKTYSTKSVCYKTKAGGANVQFRRAL